MAYPTSSIPAIDVHAHYGLYQRREAGPLIETFCTGDAAEVVRRATESNITTTIVSPLLGLVPRGEADAAAGNDEASRIVDATDGLLQWIIIHPLQRRTYDQAAERLHSPRCAGIKIHPEEHRYRITEHGDAIFAFAAEHRAVVLAHSGDPFSEPADFVPFADAYPEVRLILAHLGNGGAGAGAPDKQVRAIQSGRAGNLYTDTSGIRSVLPGLIEWAVAEVGVDRILFGTDTPLYTAASQRARIDVARLSESQKRSILRDNARALWADGRDDSPLFDAR